MHLVQDVSEVSPALCWSGSAGVIVIHPELRLGRSLVLLLTSREALGKMLTFAHFSECEDQKEEERESSSAILKCHVRAH